MVKSKSWNNPPVVNRDLHYRNIREWTNQLFDLPMSGIPSKCDFTIYREPSNTDTKINSLQ